MTVREASEWAAGMLSGTGSPAVDSRALLCSLCGWELHEVFLNSTRVLSRQEIEEYSSMVRRRASREPLQHITGITGFMGREFRCGSPALVPRQETEVLVETVIDRLESPPRLVVDVGTGSGVVAISLALEYPEALVVGTDISPEALELALINRGRLGAGNLALVSMDMVEALFPDGGARACVLAANLPYVPSGEIGSLQPEVRSWDPLIALDGGEDGMRLISRLLYGAASYVRPGGLLALEVGHGQASSVAAALSAPEGPWTDVRTARDLSGIGRVVSAVRTGDTP